MKHYLLIFLLLLLHFTSPLDFSSLPSDFIWGTATAAYQVEGAYNISREFSIWDNFTHTPGKIKNGDTGDIACDHYHRYKEDVQLMKQLRMNAYRFSISWSRLLKSNGEVNEVGYRFYHQLINELMAAGITPMVTLYHWVMGNEMLLMILGSSASIA